MQYDTGQWHAIINVANKLKTLDHSVDQHKLSQPYSKNKATVWYMQKIRTLVY